MKSIELYRVEGHFVDGTGMTWVDLGMRTEEGFRVYTDGVSLAIRSGVGHRPNALTAAELAEAGRVTP